MSSPTDTVIDVRTLIDRPGATASLDRRMPAPADLTDDIVRIEPEVTLRGIIESVVDGLLVRGSVHAAARVSCSRCLVDGDERLDVDVLELFSGPDGGGGAGVDPGYGIIDATIDLDTLIRDALADAIPVRPLCRPECAGLCPTCGADRNVAPCDGHPDQYDQRWAALADLRLPDAR